MRRLLQTIRKDSEGVAMIEFAFIAPFFLTLIVGGLELTNLALTHLRVSQMAMTVADNAGRVAAGIDEANIYEVFTGADIIANNIDFERDGRMVLSSLEENGQAGDNRGQTIRWQRCWGDLAVPSAYGAQGKGKNDSSLASGMGAPGNRIASAPNTVVMFVEVTYQYRPLIWSELSNPTTIRYESAFNVRGRQNNEISNTQRLPVKTCN